MHGLPWRYIGGILWCPCYWTRTSCSMHLTPKSLFTSITSIEWPRSIVNANTPRGFIHSDRHHDVMTSPASHVKPYASQISFPKRTLHLKCQRLLQKSKFFPEGCQISCAFIRTSRRLGKQQFQLQRFTAAIYTHGCDIRHMFVDKKDNKKTRSRCVIRDEKGLKWTALEIMCILGSSE